MPTDPGFVLQLDGVVILELVTLGFAGGVLSGVMGSGGAFLMVPGLISIGLPGPVAVGTSLLHKFARALVSFRRPLRLAPIDRSLTFLLFAGVASGVGVASAWAAGLLRGGGRAGGGLATLYVSVAYVCFMLPVALSFLRGAATRPGGAERPLVLWPVVRVLTALRVPPLLDFRVAETRVSLALILGTGLTVGYVAGTVGTLTFFLVPAMVYLLGVPRPMVAGIEAALAVLLGAVGAASYAGHGVLDVRVAMLLYLGSLIGVALGRRAGHSMRDAHVRAIAGTAILGTVFSRAIELPVYAHQLGWLRVPAAAATLLPRVSGAVLAGAASVGIALTFVFARRARREREQVEACLLRSCCPENLASDVAVGSASSVRVGRGDGGEA